MTSGVKVVGGADAAANVGVAGRGLKDAELDGQEGTEGETAGRELAPERAGGRRDRARAPRGDQGRHRPRRGGVAALAVLAVLGVAGTIGFGLAWEGLHAARSGESQARAAARSFLVDLTNFNAKTVDADFSAVSSMATGAFATQAQRFFNSTIRQELQKALASSRGQIRALYVQTYGGGTAAVYAVVDQLYVNSKLTSPQTDVLRLVVDMSQVGGRWKVGDVTVLQGPQLGASTASSGNGSGTALGTGSSPPTSAPGSSATSGSTATTGGSTATTGAGG